MFMERITIKAIKLMLFVLILGMLVASGAAQEGADTQPHDGGHNNDAQPHDGGHNNDAQPHDGGHNNGFGNYDWLNPGGVTYSFSGWNNYYPYIYPNYYYNYPWYNPTYTYPNYNYPGYYSTYTYPNDYYTTPIAPMPTQTSIGGGDTPVTIQSQGMRGYQVFLDENLIGTEGTGGDLLDGVFNFMVVGNQNHNIRVYDGQFNYPKSMYFARGVLKIINVEPGTAVYT
jgi:hypothetical protein